jgi:large subunit ribosomal protein L10
MDNPRPEKVAVVDEVRQQFDAADAAILTEYRGLTVKDLAQLRRDLRANGSEYKIYKNTLVRFATRELGLHDLDSMLVGPTAIAFVSGDAAAAAKTLRDYSRTNTHLVIKGGVLGHKILSSGDTAALAELPSRDVLLARVAGGLAAPLRQLAGLMQALPRNLAYGLAALRDQRLASEEAAAPPEAPAAPPEVSEEAAAPEAPAAPPEAAEEAAAPPAAAEDAALPEAAEEAAAAPEAAEEAAAPEAAEEAAAAPEAVEDAALPEVAEEAAPPEAEASVDTPEVDVEAAAPDAAE